MKQDYIKAYQSYQLPENLTINYIHEKVSYWKSIIANDKILSSYFDEILNILKGGTTININSELNKYSDKNLKLTQDQQSKRWD